MHTTGPGMPRKPSAPDFPGGPWGPTGPVLPTGPSAPASPCVTKIEFRNNLLINTVQSDRANGTDSKRILTVVN